MTKADGKINMAKLARLRHKEAELHAQLAETLAEQASIFDLLAEGETVDLRTGRRASKFRPPVFTTGEVTEADRAAASEALRSNDRRRGFR